MRVLVFFCVLILLFPLNVLAANNGCCSWHGGIDYCASNGRFMCNDGTYSPTCTCAYSGSDSSNQNGSDDDGNFMIDLVLILIVCGIYGLALLGNSNKHNRRRF